LRGFPAAGYLGALGCGLGLWEVCAQISYTWAPLERLTPKVLSGNAIATLAPSGKARGNAVLLAHLDTQTTPVYSRSKAAAGAFYALLYLALALLLLTAAALILSAPAGVALPLWAGAPGALLAAAMLAAMVHSHLPPYGCGANNNTSSVGVALALAEHFQRARLVHTRLWLVFSSAEETGCHGAKAFLRGYGDKLGRGYVLALGALGVLAPRYTLKEGKILARRSDKSLVQVVEQVASPGAMAGSASGDA
jgi:hypothetical protein